MHIEFKDRVRGSLMGLAVGDALGFGTEFMTQEEVKLNYPTGLKRYTDIVEDKFRSADQIGRWTDDTDMMIAILDSLLEQEKVDLTDIAANFKEWAQSAPTDIGLLTEDVLQHPNYLEQPQAVAKREWITSGRNSAGNGGIMRTAVTAIWDYKDWAKVEENTANICKLTHYDPRCVGSCVVIAYMINQLIQEKSFTLRELIELSKKYDERIGKFIEFGYQKDLKKISLDNSGIGYTLKTMAAGLWAYNFAPSFEQGIQTILLEGGDADTNCAVAGALLGAKFGYPALPAELISNLLGSAHLNTKVDLLLELIQ